MSDATDRYDSYWADLRAEEAIDRMREEEDERAQWMPDEPPPRRLGKCADPGCDGQVYDDCGTIVGSCPHWDPEEAPVES